MFPDIPNFWSWAAFAVKLQAAGAAGTLAILSILIFLRYAWPLIRWVSIGLAAHDAVSRFRDSVRDSEEN